MLTGMLAALASSIDTHLTWGASYWSNDLYLRIINQAWLKRRPSSREQVLAARLSNIFILTAALLIMANLGSIQTAWYVSLLFGAGTGAVLVLRWLWERINLFSELSAILTSLLFAPIILWTVESEWLRLLFMSSISTLVVVSVTLLTPPTAEKTLLAFYRRVDPPGFWKTSAEKLGLDPGLPMRRFRKGAYLTLTTSLSLYLLLLGCGRLLVDPGGPPLSSLLFILLGLACIRLWWPGLKAQTRQKDRTVKRP